MKFVRWVVLGGMLLLIAIQLAGFAQSLHPFFDSIGHFRLHLAVLMAVGLILLLLLRSWRLAAAATLTLAGSLVMLQPALCCEPPLPKVSLTLMQHNTLFSNPTPEMILEQVSALKPDVLTLQEVSRKTEAIMERLKAEYPYQILCPFERVGGVAVVSRLQMIERWCEPGSGLAAMRIDLGGRQVTVASIHLYWPYPHQQPQQVAALSGQLANLPQPIILAGDFNAAPWSHAVAQLAAASGTSVVPGLRLTLRLAMKLSHLGIPAQRLLPIDHVLVPEGGAAQVRIGEAAGSDHMPLFARISLP